MKKLKKTFQIYFSGSSDEKQQQAICSQHSLQNGKKTRWSFKTCLLENASFVEVDVDRRCCFQINDHKLIVVIPDFFWASFIIKSLKAF